MALSHRKLSKDPIFDATSQLCKTYCDIIFNPKGLCPGDCFSTCASTCKIPIPDFISLPPPPPPPPQVFFQQHHQLEISTRFLIFIITLVTFFAVFFCFVSYKCYKAYRYRSRSRRLRRELRVLTENTHQDFLDEDHGFALDHPIWYIRTIGLQPSVISAITICKYKKGEGLVEGTECSVCLSEFQEDETLRLLPKCNHAFHIPCIDTWLRSHTNCPLCRAGIVSNVAVLPVPEQGSDDPSVLEDARMGGLVDDNQDGRGIARGNSELRGCAREEGEPQGESEQKSNEMEKEKLGNLDQIEINEVFQPKRRSYSVDFSSAKSGEIGLVSKGVIDVDQGRLVGSSSLQQESFLMTRSFSYSDKVLLSRQNNSQSRS